MKVRMLKPFNALKAGVVADVGDGVAEFWIQCGRAERLVPPETIEVQVAKPQRKETRGRKHERSCV